MVRLRGGDEVVAWRKKKRLTTKDHTEKDSGKEVQTVGVKQLGWRQGRGTRHGWLTQNPLRSFKLYRSRAFNLNFTVFKWDYYTQKSSHQQYHDNSVVCTIFRVANRSRTSPNLSLSSGTWSSSSGMVLLLTFAIFRKISFASSTFPLTINQRTDSGVKLTANK